MNQDTLLELIDHGTLTLDSQLELDAQLESRCITVKENKNGTYTYVFRHAQPVSK